MGIMDAIKVRKAIALQQKGNLDEAMAEYEKLYSQNILDAGYLLPYTVLLLKSRKEENYQKVKDILKAIEKLPNLSQSQKQQIHLNYACAQYKLGHLPEAIHLLEASHQKAPCGNTYEALGYFYIEANDAVKGLPYNLEALDYDDEDPIVYDNLGQLYYRVIGDKEKALTYFQKAHELKESQIDTLYFLSLYDIENGDLEAAQEKLKQAQEGRFSPLNYATPEMIEAKLKEIA